MSTSITPGQRKQILRLLEDGLDAIRLTTAGAQRVITQGGELQSQVKRIICSFSGNGEVSRGEKYSTCTYPLGYSPISIIDQVKILCDIFSLQDPDVKSVIKGCSFPDGAESWFAVPNWGKVAPTYNAAVVRAVKILRDKRGIYNLLEGRLGKEHLRQCERTVEIMTRLANSQYNADILIFPAQMGMRYMNRSVDRARKMFSNNEFGFGIFSSICILLTNPYRLGSPGDPWIDCSGDECRTHNEGLFNEVPVLSIEGSDIHFAADWITGSCPIAGSPTGFFSPDR